MSDSQFDLSMRMTGDGSSAEAAAEQVETSLKEVEAANRSAAKSAKDVERSFTAEEIAQRKVAAAAAALDVAQTRVAASTSKSEIEQKKATAALAQAEVRFASAQKAAARYTNDVEKNAAVSNRAAFGARNLGQQVGDFATQVSLGGGVIRAFSSQIGQVGFAMSEMGGKAGAVGAFLTGPWGIALTVGALVLAPFVEKLFDGASAADEQADKLEKAAQSADSYGSAQSLLGKVIDLTTGKLKTQNLVLIETIKLQAQANLLAAQSKIDEATGQEKGLELRAPGFRPGVGGLPGGDLDRIVKVNQFEAQQQRFIDLATQRLGAAIGNDALAKSDPQAYSRDIGKLLEKTTGQLDRIAVNGKVAGKSLIDTKLALIGLANAGTDKAAALEAINALTTGQIADDLRPYARGKKPKKPKAPKVDRTTPGEVETIARINEEFDRTPSLVDKAAQATRKLDSIIADLSKRKPPGFEKIIADANAAKDTIQEGLQRPYQEFIRDQEQALEVQRLLTAGRIDEAAALKTVQSLQASMGPLTEEQKAAILATTQAIRAQQREVDILRQKNAKNVEAISGIKGIVEDATQAFARGDLGQLLKSPGKILDVFQTLQGRQIFDSLFGEAFRDLEDQVNGTAVVREASDKMATAVDKAAASIGKLGAAAESAAAGVAGGAAPVAGGPTAAAAAAADGDIVVTGRRDPVVQSITKVGTSIAGLFTDPAKASKIGASIGKYSGQALQGAATGSIVSGISKALGVKMSGTGAQIGGAVGSFLPIPGGSIIGSIAGGLLGGLFGKKAPNAQAVFSNSTAATVSGNNASLREGLTGTSSSVTKGLNQIVEQFGAELGNFTVSIGKYEDYYRVSSQATNTVSQKGKSPGRVPGLIYDGKDEGEAVSAAIRDAISDGAVKGLSTAVQKALLSNTDIDAALKEALKVRDLETLIGGIGSALSAQFRAFDATAADRVRLARKYGLDVLAVEKVNGEERAKLVDETLKSRIGSLTDFIEQTKFGDLFEGSASDRRTALLDEIAKVQKDAEAGVDGAADRLAQLSSQLIATSRDAYGTAGPEYTSDRSGQISAVERIIEMERKRVAEASTGTTAAVEKVAALTNETNDLLAQNVAATRDIAAAMASSYGGAGASATPDYGAVYRGSSYRGGMLNSY